MRVFLILLASTLLTGCALFQQKKPVPPPSVSTGMVIDSLTNTKLELQQAGDANTKVSLSINKALSLAERLDLLLAQIEREQQAQANKNVIKPLKQ
tara:strand:+ start:152 stop:439 length:288 start_codon:yes stop_codon:yes gene_type:complete